VDGRNAQHGQANPFEIEVAAGVVGLGVAQRVGRAIDLHGQPGARTEEVEDERADRVLAAEAQAIQATAAQRNP